MTTIEIANDDRPAALFGDAGSAHGIATVNVLATPLPIIGDIGQTGTPAGIALAFAAPDQDSLGEDRFVLRLIDQQGEVLMQIGCFSEDEIVAQWRDCSLKSGLPRMVVREDSSIVPVGQQLGRVALGTTRQRRRHGLLNGRRPRFLVRRKTARLPTRPTIYRGENEIIARR